MSGLMLRVLKPEDAEMLYGHYQALDPESKGCRFGIQISDYALRHFINNMDLRRDIHFAVVQDQEILALTQVAKYSSDDGPAHRLELGISVTQNARRRGYASLLWDVATAHATACNMQEIYVIHSPRNNAMVQFCRGKGLRSEDLFGERVGIWTNLHWTNMLQEQSAPTVPQSWPGILPSPSPIISDLAFQPA